MPKEKKKITEMKIQVGFRMYMDKKYPYVKYNADRAGAIMSKKEGSKCIARGSQTGFPDFWILKPSPQGYHAMFIEFKKPGQKARIDQQDWLNYLNNEGYYALCIDNLEDAKKEVDRYLSPSTVKRNSIDNFVSSKKNKNVKQNNNIKNNNIIYI